MSWGWMPSSTKERTAGLGLGVADERRPGTRVSALGGVGQQLVLVGGDRLAAEAAR